MRQSDDPLLDAILSLQAQNDQLEAVEALITLHKKLQKIAKHPFESKYRVIQGNDDAFQRKIGRLRGSTELIQCAGFLPTSGKRNTWELVASAEAWPKLMQATALLSQAVKEAEQAAMDGRTNTTASTSSSSTLPQRQPPRKKKRPQSVQLEERKSVPKDTRSVSSHEGTIKSAATSSAIAKFKAAALKARHDPESIRAPSSQENTKKKTKEKPSKNKKQDKPTPESSAKASGLAKLKAGAKAAGKEPKQPQNSKTKGSSQKLAAAGSALAKFKAAAQAASQQENHAQSNARQNPLKLAAQRAAGKGVEEDEVSSASERSLTLNDLQNSVTKFNQPGSKFKAAARNTRAQSQNGQNSFGGSSSIANKFRQAAIMAQVQNKGGAVDPRLQFQNAAQAMMSQRQMQANPQQDPRSRFQNAAKLMMLQQKQPNQAQDPRMRFQNAARAMMLQQKMQPSSPGKMSAAARATMKPGFDGLSYPTSASSDDGIRYPPGAAGPHRKNGGRPFALRTDSGRSLMSSSSNMGIALNPNVALVPAGSRAQMMNSSSFRQHSMRSLNIQQSSRNMMMHQQQMQGSSRPQLMREQSLTLRDLQKNPGMASSRHMVPRNPSVGGSVMGDRKPVVSMTVTHIEKPKDVDNSGIGNICARITANAVNLVTFGELVMDLVTNILSFKQLRSDFDCCGKTIDYGALTLGVTIPYFFIVVVEMAMLTYSVFCPKTTKKDVHNNNMLDDDDFDDESTVTVQWQCTMSEALSWVICINPFLGCLITWTLMYEVESRNEALLILGIEAAAIVLMFITIFLERNELSTCTMMIHLVPLVPFTVTCFVVWYYLERGGICFIVKDNTFWFDGCDLCADGFPPDDGTCPDGDTPTPGEYCGASVEEQFCYYSY